MLMCHMCRASGLEGLQTLTGQDTALKRDSGSRVSMDRPPKPSGGRVSLSGGRVSLSADGRGGGGVGGAQAKRSTDLGRRGGARRSLEVSRPTTNKQLAPSVCCSVSDVIVLKDGTGSCKDLWFLCKAVDRHLPILLVDELTRVLCGLAAVPACRAGLRGGRPPGTERAPVGRGRFSDRREAAGAERPPEPGRAAELRRSPAAGSGRPPQRGVRCQGQCSCVAALQRHGQLHVSVCHVPDSQTPWHLP